MLGHSTMPKNDTASAVCSRCHLQIQQWPILHFNLQNGCHYNYKYHNGCFAMMKSAASVFFLFLDCLSQFSVHVLWARVNTSYYRNWGLVLKFILALNRLENFYNLKFQFWFEKFNDIWWRHYSIALMIENSSLDYLHFIP